jgi:hypothetical protein
MHEIIHEKVSVVSIYDRYTGMVMPKRIRWQGRLYEIEKLGYHHLVREGRKVLHIFSVASRTMFFKLRLDTENLHWMLEEVSDGIAS